MRFELEHRPDLATHFYAELWAPEPFFVKGLGDERALPAELKGDERRLGCRYKIDVLRPYWAGWEGTKPGDVRLLWVAPAERIVSTPPSGNIMPPAPHVQLIKAGVNIGRWVEDPSPQPPPLPGEGEQPTPTPTPGPEEPGEGDGEEGGPDPTPQPDLPPFDSWVPDVVVFSSRWDVSEPSAVLWGDYELVYVVPAGWLTGARQLMHGLAERVRGVAVERRERG
jgi:hypothetical protein